MCVNKLPVCSLMPGNEPLHAKSGALKPTEVVVGAGGLIISGTTTFDSQLGSPEGQGFAG